MYSFTNKQAVTGARMYKSDILHSLIQLLVPELLSLTETVEGRLKFNEVSIVGRHGIHGWKSKPKFAPCWAV